MNCPWYVSANAVRAFMRLTGQAELVHNELAFNNASDELIELCARTWARYLTPDERGNVPQPRISKTGAYVYRASKPTRLRLIVSTEDRPEGPKWQLVDVVPAFIGNRR